MSSNLIAKRRGRVQINRVQPEIDGGHYPIKRVIDDVIEVTADVVVDGHNALAAVLRYKEAGETEWAEVSMDHTINDSWTAPFRVNHVGRWNYTITAWVDHFASWQRD